jgi:hypothetical protein
MAPGEEYGVCVCGDWPGPVGSNVKDQPGKESLENRALCAGGWEGQAGPLY